MPKKEYAKKKKKLVKRDITIFTIGDKSDFDSYKKIDKERRTFVRHGFRYATIDYRKFMKGHIPEIKTIKVIVLFYFPFSYWNKNIEHKSYKGIYGNQIFYEKFVHFWSKIQKQCKSSFRDKEVLFVNSPDHCGAYRDKLNVSRALAKFNVNEPRIHRAISVKAIEEKLARGHTFYLKPRYGSMGKGITYISQSNWQTNFIVKGSRILNRKSDRGWKFVNVTGNRRFLKQLLEKDIMIQDGVDPLIVDGYMVDLRIYTFMNEVVYVYPRKNLPDKITTNISQGGEGDPDLLDIIPKDLINKAKREAVRVSRALGINFAGVDIIPDRNFREVCVIDVNVFPGFPKRKVFNLARFLARDLDKWKHNGKLKFNPLT